jgi:hypothetical protein
MAIVQVDSDELDALRALRALVEGSLRRQIGVMRGNGGVISNNECFINFGVGVFEPGTNVIIVNEAEAKQRGVR